MPDGFDNYRWEPSIGLACDTCRTTMASPNQTTVYTGFVNDTGECEVEFRIVNVAVFNECSADNITMPNIFSPNNDGRNEIFRPLNIGVEEIISFRIFNRWGQMILDSNGNNSEWNGNYKNEPQPVGVYIYTLDIGCNGEFERRLSGDITLLK